MALKDILTSAKYADDMQIALPDGTSMTVGEMRALEAEEKQRLIQRSQRMEAAEIALAERIIEAQKRGIVPTEGNSPMGDREIRHEAAAQFGLDESDPLLGQVAKEFKRLEAENKARETALEAKFTNELNGLKGITGKLAGGYLDDYYEAKFQATASSLPSSVREKVKLEDVINYAKENNLMDKLGRYRIDAAVKQLTWDQVKEEELAKERAELRKTADKENQLASMNRPSPNALRTKHKENEGFNPLNKDGKPKTFDEALADAAEDSAFWDSVATYVN